MAPSYMSPKAGGGGLLGLSQWVQLYTGDLINFVDLTPYFTYGCTHWLRPCNSLRVSSNKQTKILVRTETNRSKISFGGVSVCFMKQKTKNFGLFRCFKPISKQLNKQNCFETNRNNPKFSEKYQNMLSIKIFRLVFCLFRFNQNIKTLCCFGIEPKQPKQTFCSDCAETSFGCFESKLVSKGTLNSPLPLHLGSYEGAIGQPR